MGGRWTRLLYSLQSLQVLLTSFSFPFSALGSLDESSEMKLKGKVAMLVWSMEEVEWVTAPCQNLFSSRQ